VIDLCRTTFLDSTGAAFLISLAESTDRRGGVTLLLGADERSRFVLEVCGALDMFRLDEDHACSDDDDHAAEDRSPDAEVDE
jgi:anti-anti-sigma regulatory factor